MKEPLVLILAAQKSSEVDPLFTALLSHPVIVALGGFLGILCAIIITGVRVYGWFKPRIDQVVTTKMDGAEIQVHTKTPDVAALVPTPGAPDTLQAHQEHFIDSLIATINGYRDDMQDLKHEVQEIKDESEDKHRLLLLKEAELTERDRRLRLLEDMIERYRQDRRRSDSHVSDLEATIASLRFQLKNLTDQHNYKENP